MRDVAILFIHLVVTVARMFGLGSARSIVAESLLVKYALFILNRLRVRAPDLRPRARLIPGLRAILMRPARLVCSAVILKLFAILGFHRALVKRKCRLLFTPENRDKPGSKGPSAQLICAIIEMKRRKPSFPYQRIDAQASLVFDIEIDKDVVRPVRFARKRVSEAGMTCRPFFSKTWRCGRAQTSTPTNFTCWLFLTEERQHQGAFLRESGRVEPGAGVPQAAPLSPHQDH